MGGMTFTNRKDTVILNKRAVQATVTPTGTYATGGDAFTPTLLGLKQVDRVIEASNDVLDPTIVTPVATLKRGKTFVLATPGSSPKLQYFETDNTEVANATDITAATRTLIFVGS